MGILNAIWSILNLCLFGSLLLGLFTGFKSLRERFGNILGVLPPLALLTAMCQHSDEPTNEQANKSDKPGSFQSITVQHNAPIDSGLGRYLHPVLEDQMTIKIYQSILLTRVNQSDSIRIQSSSGISGFVSGIRWRPVATRVSFRSNKQLHYSAVGMLEWQLLGFPIIKQRKRFDGNVAI
ncbi:hypothetical protein [Spirosoma sp.]|uniref:hypothetical protein n=1 Tax=Spirosoma sp. TaxID=1899569 RepID=UPI003B3ACDFE